VRAGSLPLTSAGVGSRTRPRLACSGAVGTTVVGLLKLTLCTKRQATGAVNECAVDRAHTGPNEHPRREHRLRAGVSGQQPRAGCGFAPVGTPRLARSL
jgi:hypothetical protein